MWSSKVGWNGEFGGNRQTLSGSGGGGGGYTGPLPNWAYSPGNLGYTTSMAVSTNSNTINANDFLLLVIEVQEIVSSDPGTISVNNGFSLLGSQTWSTGIDVPARYAVFYKVATGSESGINITWANSGTGSTRGAGYSFMDITGANTSTPVDASTVGENDAYGTALVIPSISPSQTNDLYIGLSMVKGQTPTYTCDPSLTAWAAATNGPGGGSTTNQFIVGYKELSASGATGTFTTTASSVTNHAYLAIALRT